MYTCIYIYIYELSGNPHMTFSTANLQMVKIKTLAGQKPQMCS